MTIMEDFEPSSVGAALNSENVVVPKVFMRRWFTLLLFMLYSIISYIQLMEFAVIADVIIEYYQVSYDAVNWSVLIGSVVYVVASLPASFIIDKLGCRRTIIISAIGVATGTWIKVGAVNLNRFWIVLLGQGVLSFFQLAYFPLLPKISATWFAYNEVATCCGCSFVALQTGVALSFIIPPLLVSKGETADIEKGLYTLYLIYGVLTSAIIPLLIFFFSEAPPTPPSVSQQYALRQKFSNPKTLFQTCKTLLSNKQFIILLVIFGINTAITWPLQIVSNQVILYYYPDAAYDVGVIGLLQTLLSLIGSLAVGFVLDKFKRYKETSWVVYALFLGFVALYAGTVDQGLAVVYVTSILIGIIMGSSGTLTFEMIAEFTYPESESISITLFFMWTQSLSIGFTHLFQHILESLSVVWANVMLVIFIIAADLLFFVLKFDLRRKAMQDSETKTEKNIKLVN